MRACSSRTSSPRDDAQSFRQRKVGNRGSHSLHNRPQTEAFLPSILLSPPPQYRSSPLSREGQAVTETGQGFRRGDGIRLAIKNCLFSAQPLFLAIIGFIDIFRALNSEK